MNAVLEEALLEAGADIVGFADVSGILKPEIAHLNRAISIGVCKNLNENTVRLLDTLKKKAVRILRKGGFKYLSIPADSDRPRKTFIAKLYPLFPHKIAATSAGLGWIGKNGLLINPEYGPRLSLATVLTDAEIETGSPCEKSMCGSCRLCVEYCPSEAITGNEWSREKPFIELIQLENCKDYKKGSRSFNAKPNCGFCITICPHGRRQLKRSRGLRPAHTKK